MKLNINFNEGHVEIIQHISETTKSTYVIFNAEDTKESILSIIDVMISNHLNKENK